MYDDLFAALEIDMGTVCLNGKCTRQATHILTCHQIDYCTGKQESCKAYVFCPECTQSVGDKISEHVNDMLNADHSNGKETRCRRCKMKVTKVSDVLNTEYLYPMNTSNV